MSITYLGSSGASDGCGSYFTDGGLVTDYMLINHDIDGAPDDEGDSFGHVNLTRAPRSAEATSEAGGAVELIARLSRRPIIGSTVVYSVRVSRPAAAHAVPGSVAFDDTNWARGVRILVTGAPEEAGAADDGSRVGKTNDGDGGTNTFDGYARVDGAVDNAPGRRFNVSLALVYSDDPHFSHGALYVAPGATLELTNALVLPLDYQIDDPQPFYGMRGRRALPPFGALNVTVAPGSPAHTSESGGAIALLVAWASRIAPPPPGYPVTFGVRTTNPAEAIVSAPSTITFDANNFDVDQRV